MRLTAQNIIRAINQLPRNREYQYINPRNSSLIKLETVQEPERPIQFRRYNPTKGEKLSSAKLENISSAMIWRLASAATPDRPINVDRLFSGSYNTRSVLEALVAHTSNFYVCRPGRIEHSNASKLVKAGHKHLIYVPETPHEVGKVVTMQIDIEISDVSVEAVYQDFSIEVEKRSLDSSIQQQRRHAQIQIALILIGQQLGFRTWIAQNDRGISYKGQKIAEMTSVVDDLNQERLLSAYPDAVRAAKLIDCVWFKNGRLMPAVMEVEHSTGVTSGLTRMKGFFDLAPALANIRWTIVAPDEDRQKVLEQANREQFRSMNVKFFPYSAVEELYSLCDRRKPRGVTDEFLDCFMEDCIQSH